MLLPIKLICRANKTRKDGTSIIFFQYCYSRTNRTLLNTGIAIPINFWNKKQCYISDKLPVEFSESEKLNDELKHQKRIVEDLIAHATKKRNIYSYSGYYLYHWEDRSSCSTGYNRKESKARYLLPI